MRATGPAVRKSQGTAAAWNVLSEEALSAKMLGFDCWLRMPLLVCAELSSQFHNMRLGSGVADCFRVHRDLARSLTLGGLQQTNFTRGTQG